MEKRKIALLGFGSTGQYLAGKIMAHPEMELAFVWNRTSERFENSNLPLYLRRWEASPVMALEQYVEKNDAPDLMVEMCHPEIIRQYGVSLMRHAHLFVSSLTAFAHAETEEQLTACSKKKCLFLPVGAAWGIEDIQKMNEGGNLHGLKITMRFQAAALRLASPLKERLDNYINDVENTQTITLFEGSVRDLAALAPNNVNTMTCVALAGNRIGLDKTIAVLQADKTETAHETTIEVFGPGDFYVKTIRHNPAKKGAVTGTETYASFWASLQKAVRNSASSGFHFV